MATEARWLEVSLTVNGELAEAVSEVLARYAPNGVVTESGVIYNDAEDVGTPVGPVRVYAYLPVDEALDGIRQALEEALWHLSQIEPLPPVEYKTIDDQNWMEAWKEHYHPIPIGKQLLILPAWYEQTDTSRIAVRIDPSMAFGTGTHPSTQMCMEMVEVYTRQGQSVIDVGCGSGILSIAALKMGASHALAVDVDRAAIIGTRENAAANDVYDRLEVGLGSVEDILSGKYSIRQGSLVLANILAPIILRLFEDGLADLVTKTGVLVLSGLLESQAESILAAAKTRGLFLVDQRQINDWVTLAMGWKPG